jgi:thymidylate kinase
MVILQLPLLANSIVPVPDFMFFLDVTPKEAYRRIQTRKRQEMFENLEELEQVRQRALFLALRGKWTIINADKPIGDIEEEILKSLSV